MVGDACHLDERFRDVVEPLHSGSSTIAWYQVPCCRIFDIMPWYRGSPGTGRVLTYRVRLDGCASPIGRHTMMYSLFYPLRTVNINVGYEKHEALSCLGWDWLFRDSI